MQDAVRTANEFKFRHWKHEGVVIHRCEINKATGYFKRFDDRARREKFLREFQGYVTGLPFLYYAAGVKKTDYAARYGPGGADLYHLCL